MSGIRAIVLPVIVAAVVLLVGCPSKQPASQTTDTPVADPAKAAGRASTDANATSPEAVSGDQDATALYEAKCAKCHALTKVEGRTDTADGWQETVKTMQAKDTSWISDEEAATIAAHLAEKYPQE